MIIAYVGDFIGKCLRPSSFGINLQLGNKKICTCEYQAGRQLDAIQKAELIAIEVRGNATEPAEMVAIIMLHSYSWTAYCVLNLAGGRGALFGFMAYIRARMCAVCLVGWS
jgi:hypothetical protein